MNTYKNRLPPSTLMGYIRPAPHKAGAGFRSLQSKIAHNRASGFFTCKASSRLFIRIMAGRMGPTSVGPVSILSGTANPVRLATPSFAASGGEFPYIKIGATSWPTADTPALTFSTPTLRPKSIVAFTAQKNWRAAYGLSPSAITALLRICVFHRFSATWLTISATYTSCLTKKKTLNNTPEKLTRKQHSAGWWSVCLPDIQEALCLHR
ncbi:ash family protein [Salmonella enterica]|nr:ash family protein [Salmonella enterica]